MRVGIIGGGSIGLLFGAYFGASHEVTIYTRREEQARELNEKGIKLHCQGTDGTLIKVKSEALSKEMFDLDMIFITVKQYDLPNLQPFLLSIPVDTPLCFIQNGMGHLDLLKSLPHVSILTATVEHGAKRVNDWTVLHNGVGQTNVAVYKGGLQLHDDFPRVADQDFPIYFHENYQSILVSKLIANALINPLTVIFQVKNGRLIENPYYYEVFKMMFEEIYMIFPLDEKEKAFNSIVRICENTKNNTSSMLKDTQEGRKTEIDAILGYILKVAERKGIKLQTVPMAYVMVKGIEQERR